MTSLNSYIYNSVNLSSILLEGSPAFFPTDTLPALGACPKYAQQLWMIKNRSFKKPLILMADSFDAYQEIILPAALNDANSLAKIFWPGPLTLVVPAKSKITDFLNPGQSTIGIRVPDCEQARDLLAKTGPLATTSANLSGEPPLLTPQELNKFSPSTPLLGPLPWPSCSGLASTVIIWEKDSKWKTLRQGSISLDISD